MADTQQTVVRLEFDRPRKLKAKHRYLHAAVRASGKSITELISDPFGGYPFLLQALLAMDAKNDERLTIEKCSDLIDLFIEKHGSIEPLTNGIVNALASYLRVEQTPTDEEEEAAADPNVGPRLVAAGTSDKGA